MPCCRGRSRRRGELVAMVRSTSRAITTRAGRARGPTPSAPLLALGRLAQEDFCLLAPQADGRHALQAALLCFPAHWRLAEKLGRPLAMIHAPVPGLNARLGAAADRFLANLAVERPVWRANWSVVESPELFHPQPREPAVGPHRRQCRRSALAAGRAADAAAAARDRGRGVHDPHAGPAAWARSRASPASPGRWPPGSARWTPAMAAYKGIPALREPLLGLSRRPGVAARRPPAGRPAPARVRCCSRAGLSPGMTMLAGAGPKPCRA